MSTLTSNAKSFQRRVLDWMMETFSMEVCRDTTERNHRYLEESLELVQAMGCTQSEAHQLVDYVYGRPVGEPQQEVGGALVTLAALCSAADFDMTECGDRELARCWQNIDRIRAKQAGKPKHSPLPEHAPETSDELTRENKAASDFIRGCIEALGVEQPPEGFMIDLDALLLQVIGEIESLKGEVLEHALKASGQRPANCICAWKGDRIVETHLVCPVHNPPSLGK